MKTITYDLLEVTINITTQSSKKKVIVRGVMLT